MPKPTVLVVDPDPEALATVRGILDDAFETLTAGGAAEADRLLTDHWVQVILCGEDLPGRSGTAYLADVKQRRPEVVRVLISTGAADLSGDAAIFQRVERPWRPENLILTVRGACRLFDLQRRNELLAVELKTRPNRRATAPAAVPRVEDFDDGIVRAPGSPMDVVCDALAQVAPFDVPVLLVGSSGTGKELAARALHRRSTRWNKPFVVENCGALPDELLESELFGHKKGAFTGAVEDHTGLFERADGGTVFLDEIGEVSPAFQVKLLRVLQDGEFRPVGGTRTQRVDVRVVAATNRDLEEEVRSKRFRSDLFYRLAGMVMTLPDLKDRPGDLPALIAALLEQESERMGKRAKGVTKEAMEVLLHHDWPGNVRELQNEVRRMLVRGRAGEPLGVDVLSPHLLHAQPAPPVTAGADPFDVSGLTGDLRERVSAMEARIIREALIRHHWNKSRAAKELGLSRVGLRAKLERYGLENVHPLPAPRRAVGNDD